MSKSKLEDVKYDIERCICHVPGACDDCSHNQERADFPVCMENLLREAYELLKEYQEAKPLIDAISDSVHETAKMFRQNDGLKHYDDGSSEP